MYLFFSNKRKNLNGDFKIIEDNDLRFILQNDLREFKENYFVEIGTKIVIKNLTLPYDVFYQFDMKRINDYEYIDNYYLYKHTYSKIKIVFNFDGIIHTEIPNEYLIINLIFKEEINNYLFKLRENCFAVDEYYVIINNNIYLFNIKFNNEFTEISDFKENKKLTDENKKKYDIFTRKNIYYVLNKKRMKEEECILINIKNKEEMKKDIINRNKIYINDIYLINDESKEKIKLNNRTTEKIPVFIFNDKKVDNYVYEEMKTSFNYIKIKNEEEIMNYVFENKEKISFGNYFVWKSVYCYGKSIMIPYKEDHKIPYPELTFLLPNISIGKDDIISRMKENKLRNNSYEYKI